MTDAETKQKQEQLADGMIGQKEKITILGLEYNALRSEINARTSSIFQVVSILAGVAAWAITQPFNMKIAWGIGFAAFGILSCGWFLTRDIMKAAFRVQDIENEINERAGETLLIWENEFGGVRHGYWQFRHFSRLLAERKRLNWVGRKPLPKHPEKSP